MTISEEHERLVKLALVKFNNNKSKASKALGITDKTLKVLMLKYNIIKKEDV